MLKTRNVQSYCDCTSALFLEGSQSYNAIVNKDIVKVIFYRMKLQWYRIIRPFFGMIESGLILQVGLL